MAQDNKRNKTATSRIDSNQLQQDLDTLKEKNAQQLAGLKEKLHNLRKENESLKEHLTSLRFEINTEMKTEDFMKFAQYKSVERREVFYELKNKEVKELTTIGEKTEGIYDEKIFEFNKIIKETQKTLETLLNDVLKENENLAEKFKVFMESHSSFKFLPIRDDSKNGDSEDQEELQKEELKEEVSPIVKKNCGAGEEERNEEEQKAKNEKSSKEDDKKNESQEIEEIFYKAFVAPANIIEAEASKQIKEFTQSTTSGFWDEDIFSEDNHSEDCSISRDTTGDSLKILKEFNSREYQNESNNPGQAELREKIDSESMSPEKKITTPLDREESLKENKAQGSKALASDINNLRSKYLIGKVTGEDLTDSQGVIIVPKNSLITNKIIEIAENHGKLPELIVNMTLPEALG